MPRPARSRRTNWRRVRRRTIWVLSVGQVLGGIAFGATISLGAVLAAEISGDEAFSGLATAFITLGAAALAVPLAAFASRRGRRISLATGMLLALAGVALVVVAAAVVSFPLLLLAFALIGAGQAANLQTRFAAADLATDASRGRDLSIVVWATTIGAVLGPNLVGPGEILGQAIGMPPLTGPYIFAVFAQVAAIVVYVIGLRPDPLLLAQRVARAVAHGCERDRACRPAAGRALRDHRDRRCARRDGRGHGDDSGASPASRCVADDHRPHDQPARRRHVRALAGLRHPGRPRRPRADDPARQALLAASLVIAAIGQDSASAVTVALVLLGLGWSAATVSGSALLTESSSEALRTRRQGRSDLIMNLVAATGAILAGVVLGWIGYGGLALCALVIVAVVTALAFLGRSGRAVEVAPEPAGG